MLEGGINSFEDLVNYFHIFKFIESNKELVINIVKILVCLYPFLFYVYYKKNKEVFVEMPTYVLFMVFVWAFVLYVLLIIAFPYLLTISIPIIIFIYLPYKLIYKIRGL